MRRGPAQREDFPACRLVARDVKRGLKPQVVKAPCLGAQGQPGSTMTTVGAGFGAVRTRTPAELLSTTCRPDRTVIWRDRTNQPSKAARVLGRETINVVAAPNPHSVSVVMPHAVISARASKIYKCNLTLRDVV